MHKAHADNRCAITLQESSYAASTQAQYPTRHPAPNLSYVRFLIPWLPQSVMVQVRLLATLAQEDCVHEQSALTKSTLHCAQCADACLLISPSVVNLSAA